MAGQAQAVRERGLHGAHALLGPGTGVTGRAGHALKMQRRQAIVQRDRGARASSRTRGATAWIGQVAIAATRRTTGGGCAIRDLAVAWLAFIAAHDHVIDAVAVAVGAGHAAGEMHVHIGLPPGGRGGADLARCVTIITVRGRRPARNVEQHPPSGIETAAVKCHRQTWGAFVGRVEYIQWIGFGQVLGAPADGGQPQSGGGRPLEVLPLDLARALGRVVRQIGAVANHAVDFELAGYLPARPGLLRLFTFVLACL